LSSSRTTGSSSTTRMDRSFNVTGYRFRYLLFAYLLFALDSETVSLTSLRTLFAASP
jgi:hypothetical protein